MTTNPDPHTDEFSLAICAIRYCIGRQSYIVSDGARWARAYGKRSPWVRSVIMQDLQGHADRIDLMTHDAWKPLGAEMDEKLWREVLADLKAMGEPENTPEAPEPQLPFHEAVRAAVLARFIAEDDAERQKQEARLTLLLTALERNAFDAGYSRAAALLPMKKDLINAGWTPPPQGSTLLDERRRALAARLGPGAVTGGMPS